MPAKVLAAVNDARDGEPMSSWLVTAVIMRLAAEGRIKRKDTSTLKRDKPLPMVTFRPPPDTTWSHAD